MARRRTRHLDTLTPKATMPAVKQANLAHVLRTLASPASRLRHRTNTQGARLP